MNAIEIKELRKSYTDFCLDNINLSLPIGSIMGLVGENGAGKSTLIKLIMNAVSRESGSVTVMGVDNQAPEFRRLREEIGVVLDAAYFPEVMTPRQVGAVMAKTYDNWDPEGYRRRLESFSLPEKKPFKDFSRGMKMKLAIAVALSHDPKLLILDEATSGLDPMVRDELLDVFNDFTRREDHSILISSHIVSDLEKICDYIAFLHKGKLVFLEEKDLLLEKYALVRLPGDQLEALPAQAVKGVRKGAYGAEALVEKDAVSAAFRPEHTTLEDIILFMAKEDK